VEEERGRNVWFHTKLTMAALLEAPQRRFAVFLAEFEVRETLYMLRGSYGSVLSKDGAQGAEISRFSRVARGRLVVLSRPAGSFEAQTGRESREILSRVCRFEGDPLGGKPGRAEFEGDPRLIEGSG
jgi:hypothetical protein